MFPRQQLQVTTRSIPAQRPQYPHRNKMCKLIKTEGMIIENGKNEHFRYFYSSINLTRIKSPQRMLVK